MKGSVLVVLIVLEGLEEVVVLGEGLVAAGFGHVESAILHLLAPEGHWLLSLIACTGIDQLLEFLIAGDLASFFEAQ